MKIPRRKFIRLAGASLLGAASLGAYTFQIEPYWLDLTSHSICIKNLPSHLVGRTIIQISDLHVCDLIRPAYLLESFDRIRAIGADYIVYTGDFISVYQNTRSMVKEIFPFLPQGTRGTVGILGNHDYGAGWAQTEWADFIVGELARVGIPILRNSRACYDGLWFIGLDDLWAKKFDPDMALAGFDLTLPSIVLSHNPDSLDVGNWHGYSGLVLAGHTHGGQCKPPFLDPPLLPVKNKRYTAGFIRLSDGRTVYINRGLGFLKQVRFNVRPEVSVFTLVSSA